MGWLAKLSGAASKEEMRGLSLGKAAVWKVDPPKSFPALLRALPALVPEGSILYLESSGHPPQKIATFLKENCIAPVSKIALGTIWPKPTSSHLLISQENMEGLAVLAEECQAIQVAVHIHVYKDEQVLLEWYDAFFTDPMYMADAISEDRLRSFCKRLDLRYKRFTDNGVEPSL